MRQRFISILAIVVNDIAVSISKIDLSYGMGYRAD